MIRSSACAMATFLIALATTSATAGDCCDHCGRNCQTRLVAKTIMVPTVVVETRMKSHVVRKMVEKEETYTVFKRVPVKQVFEKETCYLDDEIKTQTITQKKCHRVKNPVVRNYAVNVPVEEVRQVAPQSTCDCDHASVGQPCTCKVTRMKRDMATTQYEVDDVVFETITKEISYCIKVPKKHKEFCAEEITYKLEPVEKTRKVQVCVPEIVKKPVETCVTKMLPKVVYCCETCCARH